MKKFKMVAPIYKNTNVSLILKVCYDMFCMLAKHKISSFLGFFRGGQDFLDPQIVNICPTTILLRTVHITSEYKSQRSAVYRQTR